MTIEQAKEEVQKRYKYDISRCISFHWGEIAIEYAKAKWDEACEAQQLVYFDHADSENKPEFKP